MSLNMRSPNMLSPVTSPMSRSVSFGSYMPPLFPPTPNSPSLSSLDALAEVCAAQSRVSTMHSSRYSTPTGTYSSVRTTSDAPIMWEYEPPASASR